MAVFSFVYSSLTFSFQIYKLIFNYPQHHFHSAKDYFRLSITSFFYVIDKHTAINNSTSHALFLQEFTSILQFCIEVFSFNQIKEVPLLQLYKTINR